MNLYEINEQIEMLTEQMVDPETGEINEDIMGQIDDLEIDYDTKMENCGVVIKSLTAEVDVLTAEKKALESRIKVKMNKIERLCNYINANLKGQKKEYPKVAFGYRKGSKVNVVSEELVPDDLCRYETTRKPIKSEISKLLKAGEEVPGCVLEETMNLQIK